MRIKPNTRTSGHVKFAHVYAHVGQTELRVIYLRYSRGNDGNVPPITVPRKRGNVPPFPELLPNFFLVQGPQHSAIASFAVAT